MAKTNLSLGNLYRATVGSNRTTQTVSLNARNASAGTAVSFGSFAIDIVTPVVPTYTYIVESTTEAATFSFGSSGAVHGVRVGSVAANYAVSFNNANFSVGSPTLGASPSFPITPAAISAGSYSEASAVLSMTYADGYNINASNYNATTTKTLYAVDVYNTINEPDFCLLFGAKVEKEDGTTINVEDLQIGDVIKAWVPVGLPDESQPVDSDQVEWRFYQTEQNDGSVTTVTVRNLVFNFAEYYHSINSGKILATRTHPLWVWDNEISKYHFKVVGDILPGDRLVEYDEINGVTEELVVDVEVVKKDVEIVTVDVENDDVFISNGLVV